MTLSNDLGIPAGSLNFDLMGTVDGTVMLFTAIIILGLFFALVMFILYILSFKHNVVIRELVNSRRVISYDRAREFKDKEGNLWWKLLKNKAVIEVPPPEALDITTKGKKVVEVYKLETGDFVYIKDTCKIKEIPSHILERDDSSTRKKEIDKWMKDERVDFNFTPLSPGQRMALVNQIEKAYTKKKKDWKEYVLPIAYVASITLIIISILVFWGDIAKPFIDRGNQELTYQKQQTEQLRIIQNIETNVQVIKGQVKEIEEDVNGIKEAAPN